MVMCFQSKNRRLSDNVSLRESMITATCDRKFALIDTVSLQSALERRYPLGLLSTEEIQALLEPFKRV